MKWKRKQQQEEQQGKSSSSSPFNFSISQLLPFSWISKLKLNTSKPKQCTRATSNHVEPSPPPPHCSPEPVNPPLAASSHIDHISNRSPPSTHNAGDVPRRLSLGDDEGQRPRRTQCSEHHQRSASHHFVGDFEATTLGHHIPFTTRSSRRWSAPTIESDSGSNRSPSSKPRDIRSRPWSQRSKLTNPTRGRYYSDCRVSLPRKSFSGKIRHRAKVHVCSPRVQAATRPEAGKKQTAARRRSRAEVSGSTGLERFAVMKCSDDPQRDFRESMVEMIWQKRIGRPEELESLLACYLSLNSDEHHDIIVKVFRQVWFELNPERFTSQYS